MAVKLDVSKAYEYVEWPYLEHMLSCFSFHELLIKWIMTCVTIMTYSIQVNSHKISLPSCKEHKVG